MKIPPATRAKWLAEKAGWRLANRGDTWYAAERRLYKRQMTELRKALHLEAVSYTHLTLPTICSV